MRISDWSSDVCSSDLCLILAKVAIVRSAPRYPGPWSDIGRKHSRLRSVVMPKRRTRVAVVDDDNSVRRALQRILTVSRSDEHTSELQSLMRISYAVFCLKKKNTSSRLTTSPDEQMITHH